MRHKNIFKLIVPLLLACLLFASCEEEAATASLRINLDPGAGMTRAIVPDATPLNVAKYRIEGNGPNGQSFSLTTTRHQATVDGLALGKWTIKAVGLNTDDLALVKGQTEFTLTPSSRSCIIHVDTLIGNGSFSVNLTWKGNIVENPKVVVSLTPQSGEKITEEPAVSGTAVSWRKDELPAGSYIFQAQLYSGKFLMGGLTEAVRIVDQKTSTKDLTFSLDEFPYSPGSLQIYDSTGTPITCVITGVAPSVESGKAIDVKLVPETVSADPIEVKWYLDGDECGTGIDASFTCLPGKHRLDAVAYTTKIGSYGSATVTFEAVISTENGVPGNGRRYTEKDGLKLGADTALAYADNSLIVVSGENDSLQVTDLIRNQISVASEFGPSTIAELSYVPQGIGVSGNPIDADGTLGLFLTTNASTDGVKLIYDPQNKSVVRVEHTGDNPYPEATEDKILQHFPRIKWDPSKNHFISIVKVDDKTNDKIYNGLAARKCSRKGAEEVFADYVHDPDFSYEQNHTGQHYLNTVTFGISGSGLEYLTVDDRGIVLRSLTIYLGNLSTMDFFNDTCLEKSKYVNSVAIEYSRTDNAYIAGKTFIGVLDPDRDVELQYLPLSGADIADFLINPEYDSCYALDRTGKKVYTWSIAPDGKLSGLKETPVGGIYDSMAISQDGTELALWNRADADAVEILRIKLR